MDAQVVRFCMFGQVDVGKSTCAGHLIKLTNGIASHDFEKIKEKCVKDRTMTQLYSRILDVNEEEQIKGKTHEFSITKLSHKNHSFELLDTPGHKAFIRELINCISQYEVGGVCNVVGCCILSAKEGEFESGLNGGQTKEDLIIAKSLGIDDLIVLVNKLDTHQPREQPDRYNKIVKQITPFVRDTCKFKSVTYLPVSGYEGLGLIDVYPYIEASVSFIDALVSTSRNLSTRQVKKVQPKDDQSSVIVNFRVMQCENVIAPGFTCVVHYNGKEYDCVVEKIKGKRFLRSRESGLCKFGFNPSVNVTVASRMLVRSATMTLGYATIEA